MKRPFVDRNLPEYTIHQSYKKLEDQFPRPIPFALFRTILENLWRSGPNDGVGADKDDRLYIFRKDKEHKNFFDKFNQIPSMYTDLAISKGISRYNAPEHIHKNFVVEYYFGPNRNSKYLIGQSQLKIQNK